MFGFWEIVGNGKGGVKFLVVDVLWDWNRTIRNFHSAEVNTFSLNGMIFFYTHI